MSAAGGPVLITGLDHAGKTPLRVTLDAHPDLALMRRAYLWTWFDGRFGPLADPGNRARSWPRSAATGRSPSSASTSTTWPTTRRGGSPQTYDRLFALLGEAHAARQGRPRWGVQESWLEADAGRCSRRTRRPGSSNSYAIPGRGGRRSVRHPAPGRRRVGAEHGRRSRQLALRNLARHPDRYRVVRYEALAAEPEATVREVAAFLGLELADPLLEAAGRLRLDPGRPKDLGLQARLLIERMASGPMEALGYHGIVEPRGLAGLRFRLVTDPIARVAVVLSHTAERLAGRRGRARHSRAAARKVRLRDT